MELLTLDTVSRVKLQIMNSTTGESFVIMEAEFEELKRVGAIEFAINYPYCLFVCLPSQSSKTFSSTVGLPKLDLLVVSFRGGLNDFQSASAKLLGDPNDWRLTLPCSSTVR